MQFPADDRGNGFDEHRRAVPVVPFDRNATAEFSGKSMGDQSSKSTAPTAFPQQRGKLDDNLFSEDPRRQYAALKEMEASTAITKARYDRIHDIRWTTRHLTLAELAERLLKEKRSSGPISKDTHQEILSLIRQCERQQRQRLLKALQEDPAITRFPRAAVARWLALAALAGFVLGGGLAYLLVPRGGRPDPRVSEAYLDTHTGKLIAVDSESEKHLAAALAKGDWQPAFYCWNCRQWLPVKNPQKPDTPLGRPPHALLNRPITPQTSPGSGPRQ
jgi:hypothetical protein